MINLLPPEIKQNIEFGRRNRIITRWILAVIVVIAGISAMTVFGQLFINKNVRSLQAVAKITQTRIANQNLTTTQADIKQLSTNFTTVTQLLSKQILFSKIITKIGSIMPNGAFLNGITLTSASTSLDLNVLATDRDAATQAFVNISDPKNGLFDKADLISVACNTKTVNNSTISQSKYPCTASIKVTFKTDSSFYFLSSLTKSGSKN